MIAIKLFSCARRLLGRLSVQEASTRKPIRPATREFASVVAIGQRSSHQADAVSMPGVIQYIEVTWHHQRCENSLEVVVLFQDRESLRNDGTAGNAHDEEPGYG